jgi:hypothetical protein
MIPQRNDTDLEGLIAAYTREAAELKQALLDGALWEEVKERRSRVTQLAIAIHQKKERTGTHPAANALRAPEGLALDGDL